MPIYEYECHACGHRLEKLQKISDPPLTDCPACGEPGLRKLVSAVAFRLKGAGWYETDFKDEKSRRNLAKDDSKTADTDGAKTPADGDKGKEKAAKTDAGATGKKAKAATGSSGGSTATTPPSG